MSKYERYHSSINFNDLSFYLNRPLDCQRGLENETFRNLSHEVILIRDYGKTVLLRAVSNVTDWKTHKVERVFYFTISKSLLLTGDVLLYDPVSLTYITGDIVSPIIETTPIKIYDSLDYALLK